VLVGATAKDTSSVDRLKQVVGSVQWNGTSVSNPGNASTADLFIPPNGGSFSDLGTVLRAISAADCGGTVTVQKKIDTNGTLNATTQPWSYTSDTGVQDLDPNKIAAITFDYQFQTGVTQRSVEITEQPAQGFTLDRVDCTSLGQPFDPTRKSASSGGVPGVKLTLKPDEAVSCTFISKVSS
jgi:hypothetical protein